MEEIQQAYHELDRLQGIITRHEGHMFSLRGWLLVIVGGLLTAYYTATIDMSPLVLKIALLLITLLFLIAESRHVNVVESVVERATTIEKQIINSRRCGGSPVVGWYDGPMVSDACLEGTKRWWPRGGMTFVLNQPFYFVVIVIVVFTTVWLPRKQGTTAADTRSGAKIATDASRAKPAKVDCNGLPSKEQFVKQKYDANTIRLIQECLTSKGIYNGPVDGIKGPLLIDALGKSQAVRLCQECHFSSFTKSSAGIGRPN